MDLGLRERTAMVAGSTSGLGFAVATALGKEGANVVITGRRRALAEELAAGLPSAIGLALDLADPESIETAISTVEQIYGGVDIVVLNSGGPPPAAAAGLPETLLEPWLNTLLLRQIQLVTRVLPRMRSLRWGRVLAIGSRGVQEPLEDLAVSNIGRGALAAFLKTLSSEVAVDAVTVNMILPGRIDTDRVMELDRNAALRQSINVETARRRSEEMIPARRYGTPAEFGSVACFLCSEESSYITGIQMRVDGGLARGY
ncbi:MAG TPA: SDR family oxidoreductase [Candidatus Dormibacteraeota bacterium]|nr:SDR family oxidoreductase [Candidatus Dormibacteraeota bacterium]